MRRIDSINARAIRNYDAWKCNPPPEPEFVCPCCETGFDYEDKLIYSRDLDQYVCHSCLDGIEEEID